MSGTSARLLNLLSLLQTPASGRAASSRRRKAFGAEELGRVTDDRGVIGHAEARIGDAIVMLFDADPSWPATPAFLRLYVEDARAVHRRAVEAGGVSISEVTTWPSATWSDGSATRSATCGGSRPASRT